MKAKKGDIVTFESYEPKNRKLKGKVLRVLFDNDFEFYKIEPLDKFDYKIIYRTEHEIFKEI